MFIPEKSKKLATAVGYITALSLGATVAIAEDAVSLEIDKDASRVAAHVRATGHSFDAVVTDYEVDVIWDRESGEVASAVFTFDFANVKSGRDGRDEEMLEWLDYNNHPVATFVLDELERREEAFVARGLLTMHGQEGDVEFEVNMERTDDRIRLNGSGILDHRDWGLERIRAFLFMTVDPELRISFEIDATIPEE